MRGNIRMIRPELKLLFVLLGSSAIVNESIAQSGPATTRLATSVSAKPAVEAAPIPADPLLAQIDNAIDVTTRRYLTANVHSPWQIFHGILALKSNFELKLGDGKVKAIEWIATSEPKFDNQPLLMKTPHGAKFHPFTRKYAFEGHPAQFMALMSQSDLPVDYKFKVNGESFMIADFLNNIMKEVNSQEEVTWVLWCLQHYLKPDASWVNQRNEPWSIPRLVQIETAAQVVGAPCGGNHRLFALKRTLNKHLKFGGKLEGIWAQTDLKIRQHIELARSLQNADGSFSSKFYAAPGYTNDLNERFNTTGHTMEFLSIGLPDSRLGEQWVRNAVSVLSNELIVNRQRQIDCGPLYHSLNALIIYRDRVKALMPTETPKTIASERPVNSLTTTSKMPLETKPVAVSSVPTETKPANTTATEPKGADGKTSAPSSVAKPMESTPPAKSPAPASDSAPADALNPDVGKFDKSKPDMSQQVAEVPGSVRIGPSKRLTETSSPETRPALSGSVKSDVAAETTKPKLVASPSSKEGEQRISLPATVLMQKDELTPKTDSPLPRAMALKAVPNPATVDLSRVGTEIVSKISSPNAPALLPKVDAAPLESLDVSSGPLEASNGTTKPDFRSVPAPSRFATLSPGQPAPRSKSATLQPGDTIEIPGTLALPEPLLLPELLTEEPVSALEAIRR